MLSNFKKFEVVMKIKNNDINVTKIILNFEKYNTLFNKIYFFAS